MTATETWTAGRPPRWGGAAAPFPGGERSVLCHEVARPGFAGVGCPGVVRPPPCVPGRLLSCFGGVLLPPLGWVRAWVAPLRARVAPLLPPLWGGPPPRWGVSGRGSPPPSGPPRWGGRVPVLCIHLPGGVHTGKEAVRRVLLTVPPACRPKAAQYERIKVPPACRPAAAENALSKITPACRPAAPENAPTGVQASGCAGRAHDLQRRHGAQDSGHGERVLNSTAIGR